MKRNVKLLGAMALVGALAFSTSCKKNDQTTTATVAMPQVKIVNVESERAYIDYDFGNVMRWEEGDALMVYNLHRNYQRSEKEEYTIVDATDNPTYAIFHGNPLHRAYTDGYLVFYPSWKVYGDLTEGNRQDFEVPDDQKYQFGMMVPRVDPRSLVMAGKVAQLDEEAVLSHIFGFANFRFRGGNEYLPEQYRGQRVKNVVLETNSLHITGKVSVKLPGVDPERLNELVYQCNDAATSQAQADYWADLREYLYGDDVDYYSYEQGNVITLDCSEAEDGEGVALSDQITYFLFSLRPGSLIDGFTLTVNFMDESVEPIVVTKFQQADNRYCMLPGYLKNFNCNFSFEQ